jgi:hypothetical protein
MAHLEEVELTGLTGTDCELRIMNAVLASARGLHRVDIGFNPKCGQHEGKMHLSACYLTKEYGPPTVSRV